MQSAATVLGVLRERGRRGLPLDELYRQLFNPQLYLLAYGRIYANHGAMTPGVTQETVDGMFQAKVSRIIAAMRHERYRFAPVRRVLLPKNGKTRLLGLPTWSDKVVGEVVRLLLEAYYEPTFSDRSPGFRLRRGGHTASREIADTWTGTSWFIKGDVPDDLGLLDHDLMITILSENIHDNRFLRLVRNMLTAGYLEDWQWGATLSGASHGGVASPILSSIYLHKLDQFVETVLIPECTRGGRRAPNPAYLDLQNRLAEARRRGDRPPARALRRRTVSLPIADPDDPGYRRLRYCRYADDHLLGSTGLKAEAEENKQRLVEFPRDVIKAKPAPDLHRGQPAKQKALTNGGDHTIVAAYGAVYRGSVQYYLSAGDVYRVHRLRWVMETSVLTCFEARIARDGRQPLVARFGEMPLHRQKTATVADRQPIRVDYPHKELVPRVLADVCEVCQQPGKVEVHHVRKLADLGQPGPLQPQWVKAMAIRRRKTFVVCASCHGHIHRGQPATPLTQ